MFETALAVGPDERKLLLEQSGADREIRETVVEMLQADMADDSVFDRGVPAVARELLAVESDTPTRPPIDEFGPYRPIRLLGEGGMGVVWLAKRIDTGIHPRRMWVLFKPARRCKRRARKNALENASLCSEHSASSDAHF